MNTNDLDGAVDSIMREAGSYYVIDVADPPVGRKFDLRKLDVKVAAARRDDSRPPPDSRDGDAAGSRQVGVMR